MHVLDWRERAHEFGLPVEHDSEAGHVVLPADQLLEEEEPEAFEDQDVEDDEELTPPLAELAEEAAAELPAAGPRAEIDLVRTYLAIIGKRRLLKAKEEQEIGRRIETARAALQEALGTIPCAVQTLLSLADEVKHGTAPAAELILLPDGGELRKDNVTPVLKAFDRVRKEAHRIDEWRRA